MSDHFRAFSFVDRILSDSVGERIEGEYRVPGTIAAFPSSLVAESIGQCAAMSSMKVVDFRFRPVAGIAGAVDFFRPVRPGEILRLEATLVKADEEAVGYDGVATVDGEPVVRLHDCLGPMVPMEDFDDPAAVAARYDLLSGEGAEPGVFPGVPLLDYEAGESEPGEWAEGLFRIPETGSFFGDHFPRRPVFPGTLLMDAKLRFVEEFAAGLPGDGSWEVAGMRNIKLRAFMPPGEELSFRAEAEKIGQDSAVIRVQSRRGKRNNSSARVQLQRK